MASHDPIIYDLPITAHHRMYYSLHKEVLRQFLDTTTNAVCFWINATTSITLEIHITDQKWKKYVISLCSCWGWPHTDSLQIHLESVKTALDCSSCHQFSYDGLGLQLGPQFPRTGLRSSLHQWSVDNFILKLATQL